jgi:hypothetical protein
MFDDQSVGNASGNVGRCHRFDVREREMSLLVHNKVRRAIAMLLGERPKTHARLLAEDVAAEAQGLVGDVKPTVQHYSTD